MDSNCPAIATITSTQPLPGVLARMASSTCSVQNVCTTVTTVCMRLKAFKSTGRYQSASSSDTAMGSNTVNQSRSHSLL